MSKVIIDPMNGFVVIEPDKDSGKSSSGLEIVSKGEKPLIGTIYAVGRPYLHTSGVDISCDSKIGDRIVYQKYTDQDIVVDGKEYKIVKFEHILATLKEIK